MNNGFDVFISYKHTHDGVVTEDYLLAKEIYQELSQRGIETFFSEESIFKMGKSDYKKAIDVALDTARLLLVIATKEIFLTSGWIEYEYESFYEDILSDRKNTGDIISYTKNIDTSQLPRTLSRFQNYSTEEISVQKVADFISISLSNTHIDIDGKNNVADKENVETRNESTAIRKRISKGSNYASDYSNELNRLSIQARNARRSDEMALHYIFEQNPWTADEKINVLDIGSAYGFVAADRFGNDERVNNILCIDYNERVIERAEIIFAENEKMIFEVIDIESPDFEDNLQRTLEKYNIEKIHIFYSALTLHHLKDPNRLLRRIRKFMRTDSFIVLRGSDDGSKLCFPGSELMDEIIEKSANARGASDRFNGRKIYSQLSNSGFKHIRIFSDMKDISEFEYDERESLFQESFSYRVNYFKRAAENDPGCQDTLKILEWMTEALEEFETQFFESNFWYCEYDYVGVARK